MTLNEPGSPESEFLRITEWDLAQQWEILVCGNTKSADDTAVETQAV